MTFKKFIEEPMPKYSLGEEIFNYVSHIVGGSIGIFIIIFSSIYGGINKIGTWPLISLLIFGISTLGLYTISALYHGLKANSISKRVFRILDHCAIFLLIAGTYTPICAISLWESLYGPIILIAQWGAAIIGITFNAIDMHNKVVKVLSMILYIVMGWGIIVLPGALVLMSTYQFLMILLGGVAYTIGVVFFILGSKKKWFHSIFHIFCCAGTSIQLLGIIDMMVNI